MHNNFGNATPKSTARIPKALNVTMDFDKAHTSYRNSVFVFYLWLGAFVVPMVFPFELPVTDSVKGINIMLAPALLTGIYYAPRVIRSGVKSDIAVFIVLPVLLILVGGSFRAISI
jgi:hypothetical protein